VGFPLLNFKILYGLIIIITMSCLVLIFEIGEVLQQQYADGTTNPTCTMCINDKCVRTVCPNNQPCRTFTLNSTTIPDNFIGITDNATSLSIPLETI
jgi:hypothetical protein